MKKPINNPYTEYKGYNCFGCSPDNPHGLRMNFELQGDEVLSEWQPDKNKQGWFNVLHGGIQATLMDEIASWLVSVKLRTSGVTCKMDIKLLKTVFMDKGPVKLRARLFEMRRNIAVIYVELTNAEGELCVEGFMHYFTFSEKVAREKFLYPGYEKFLPNEAELS